MGHLVDAEAPFPMESGVRISQAQPEAACHVYPAGHGFNRQGHPDWHEDSAQTALERSLAFFSQHLGTPA